VSFSVPAGSLTLEPGASASVNVTLAAAKGAAGGHKQAVLQVWAGGSVVAQSMLYAWVK
jgi:hypothetical protein